ncbi:hypothetical protein ACWGST_07645 [Agromyces sp. NPDC055520]
MAIIISTFARGGEDSCAAARSRVHPFANVVHGLSVILGVSLDVVVIAVSGLGRNFLMGRAIARACVMNPTRSECAPKPEASIPTAAMRRCTTSLTVCPESGTSRIVPCLVTARKTGLTTLARGTKEVLSEQWRLLHQEGTLSPELLGLVLCRQRIVHMACGSRRCGSVALPI